MTEKQLLTYWNTNHTPHPVTSLTLPIHIPFFHSFALLSTTPLPPNLSSFPLSLKISQPLVLPLTTLPPFHTVLLFRHSVIQTTRLQLSSSCFLAYALATTGPQSSCPPGLLPATLNLLSPQTPVSTLTLSDLCQMRTADVVDVVYVNIVT